MNCKHNAKKSQKRQGNFLFHQQAFGGGAGGGADGDHVDAFGQAAHVEGGGGAHGLLLQHQKNSSFDYETLVRFMLPGGMLDYFEVTNIEEEVTDERDETGTVIRILHIYLDERDLRDKVWHDLQPNGFTEPRLFNDFPQREHKVLLHVWRRRWLDKGRRNVVLESLPLVAEGTCYSVELADFLKKMAGYLPGDGPMRGALLPD